MPSTSPAADTDAWRDLLPWMADDELRQLLDERGARMLGERLRAAGIPVRLDAAPLDLVAEVLAEIHGARARFLDGEPIPSRP